MTPAAEPDVEPGDAERLTLAEEFLARMSARRSCRAFSDVPVDRAIIETAIRTAATAPSAANHQPWHFAVIGSPEAKAAVRVAAEEADGGHYGGVSPEWRRAMTRLGCGADKPFLEEAAWLIVVFGQDRGGVEAGEELTNFYITESVCLATGFLIASLHVAGIATLVHAPHPTKFLRRVCGRPESERPIAIICVGHAVDDPIPAHPAATHRKSHQHIASWI